jgi:hypothetical protein
MDISRLTAALDAETELARERFDLQLTSIQRTVDELRERLADDRPLRHTALALVPMTAELQLTIGQLDEVRRLRLFLDEK